MKRFMLGAAIAAILVMPAFAQTGAATTNPESVVTANPKSNMDTPQCTQPAPGEAHMNTTNCPNVPTATPPKTIPKAKTKTAPATTATKPSATPSSVLPTDSNACPKTGSSTPSNPKCDTNSGAHEGGPFGH